MTAADTYVLLRAFVDELGRSGMKLACTSPGSRNTPLILSLARDPRICTYSHIDERCAGFFALGAAKATNKPVAVTCTSGTAAANLAPAVVEAYESRTPLIVLTADRPPELRDVGAGQTIDQLKLYGDAVKWFFEVGVDDATAGNLRWIRTLACRAYATAALDGRPGPVHLNFPLREPLTLDGPLPSDDTGREGGRPYVVVEPPHVRAGGDGRGSHPAGRVLIVAGTGTPDPAGLAAYAERQRIPVLADPLSGARRGEGAIAHYDLLLRDQTFTGGHRPDFVLRIGELPTSKPLRTWLATLTDVPQIAFDPHGTWHDPAAVVGMRIHSRLPMPDELKIDPSWLDSWRAADEAAAGAIRDALKADDLSEPLVAATLCDTLPAEATVFAASSMPIRDLEEFVAVRDDPPRVLSNRGANGIDGTVSSAFGAAAAGGPVVLLIGDVALAHDIGGLLAGKRLGIPLTIVVLNNDGGGIFHFLAVATQTDAFEEHIATPHGLEFERAASLYGCGYVRVATASELRNELGNHLGNDVTIIEIRTDRERNLELHRRVAERVRLPG